MVTSQSLEQIAQGGCQILGGFQNLTGFQKSSATSSKNPQQPALRRIWEQITSWSPFQPELFHGSGSSLSCFRTFGCTSVHHQFFFHLSQNIHLLQEWVQDTDLSNISAVKNDMEKQFSFSILLKLFLFVLFNSWSYSNPTDSFSSLLFRMQMKNHLHFHYSI